MKSRYQPKPCTGNRGGPGTTAQIQIGTRPRSSKQGPAALALLLAPAFAGPVFAANLIVNTLNDEDVADGVCSLREAIIAANNDADHNGCVGTGGYGADTIIFNVSGDTITLGSTLPEITDGAGLNIDGGGQVAVSGQGDVRIMVVAAGAVVELVGLTVADGFDILFGGGVENHGALTVRNSTFSGNNAGTPGGGFAGGIRNSGTLIVTHSAFSGNSAGLDGGGIHNTGNGTLTVTDSTFSGNNASAFGGGIRNDGTLTVRSSTFSGNTVGGASGGDGGGILNSSDFATISDSTFTGNSAVFEGGGIYSSGGTLTIANSTFTENSARFGGGGGNSQSATLFVTNSTFSGNSVDQDGGGIHSFGTLTVAHSTFLGNSAKRGGGIFIESFFSDGILNLANTILADSTGGDCINFSGVVNAAGVNLIEIEDGSCDPDAITADPRLDPAGLQDNGGPTRTIALCQGADSPAGCVDISPAIDAVPAADCSLATDQRGEFRPVDGDGDGVARCDIGAYELQVPVPFDGFFAPVDNPPTVNRAKAGQGIPIKFSLGGDRGLDIFQQGYPKAAQIACDSGAPSEDVDETLTAGASGLQYDPDTDSYTYAWKTRKNWKGSCRKFAVKLIDGSEHSALFEFK